MFYEVIPTKLYRSGKSAGVLTYTAPTEVAASPHATQTPENAAKRSSNNPSSTSSVAKLHPGQIVEIPLGRSHTTGIILRQVKSVNFPTKPITRVIYDTPLPPHLLKAMEWLAAYYLSPLPAVANLFLPTGVEKSRRTPRQAKLTQATNAKQSAKTTKTAGVGPAQAAKTTASSTMVAHTTGTAMLATGVERSAGTTLATKTAHVSQIPLNPAQKQALQGLQSLHTSTKLLHGITGSGKTNIYLQLASECLRDGKSTVLLVPEIALTSQLVSVFEQAFSGRVILIHSRQTEAQRHQIWEQILQATAPVIIIGPRSALLSPVKDLGLIIIDEAHESSYYQENPPRYSTLRLASYIASTLKIPCVQGTATPLVADYYLAQANHAVVPLQTKAKTTATAPDIHIIDLKLRDDFSKNRYFSNQLLAAIRRNLKEHHQTLIFHNRRGSAPMTICENCGWQALCPDCFLPLTLHTDSYQLLCHACGYATAVPVSCPDCGHPEVVHKGFGTKLLEMELNKLFKEANVVRFDADNAKTETLDRLYDRVRDGDFDIIVGTQTIAKGLDLPLLATVGVAQADAGLNLPDFAAEERTFHLLTQVIGRVGRGHLNTAEVFIQTYHPDHPAIICAQNDDYAGFYQYLLKKRRQGHLPPFTYLAKVSLTYKTETTVLKHIQEYHRILAKLTEVDVSAPTPAFHERSTSGYTWQLTLRAKRRQALLEAIAALPSNQNLHFTIDPPGLL